MDSGIFKWIWRFNAVVIALAVTGVGLLIAPEVLREYRSRTGPVVVSDVVNVDETDATLTERFNIDLVTSVDGTDLLRFALMRSQSYDYGFSTKTTDANTVNYGFIDRTTGNTRWLLDGNTGLILRSDSIWRDTVDASGTTTQVLIATVYLVVQDDTSGDERLNHEDSASLMIARPDGTGLEVIATEVTGWLGAQQYNADTQLFVVNDGKQTQAIFVAMDTFAVTQVLPLPQP